MQFSDNITSSIGRLYYYKSRNNTLWAAIQDDRRTGPILISRKNTSLYYNIRLLYYFRPNIILVTSFHT